MLSRKNKGEELKQESRSFQKLLSSAPTPRPMDDRTKDSSAHFAQFRASFRQPVSPLCE
jgi:hypothetical protein